MHRIENEKKALGGRGRDREFAKPRLSVVIPMRNEAGNIVELVRRLQEVATQLVRWEMEVLFVDDGSSDNSVQKIREIRTGGVPVGYIRLSRNFGHQAAICAGMERAIGEAVITMDADLQHPPEEIPRMVAAHEEGADVVQMARSGAASAGKGLFSKLFYETFNKLSDMPIVPNAPDFRLMSRRVLDVLLRIPEREKFVRGLVPSLGFQQTTLEFDEAKRTNGTPSYSFWMSLRLARRAIFDYSTVPLRLVFWLGMAISVLAFMFGTGHLIWKLLHWDRVVPGFTDLITAIFFLGGCMLASLGILGRYVLKILEQVRARPTYVIMDEVRGEALSSATFGQPSERRVALGSVGRAAAPGE